MYNREEDDDDDAPLIAYPSSTLEKKEREIKRGAGMFRTSSFQEWKNNSKKINAAGVARSVGGKAKSYIQRQNSMDSTKDAHDERKCTVFSNMDKFLTIDDAPNPSLIPEKKGMRGRGLFKKGSTRSFKSKQSTSSDDGLFSSLGSDSESEGNNPKDENDPLNKWDTDSEEDEDDNDSTRFEIITGSLDDLENWTVTSGITERTDDDDLVSASQTDDGESFAEFVPSMLGISSALKDGEEGHNSMESLTMHSEEDLFLIENNTEDGEEELKEAPKRSKSSSTKNRKTPKRTKSAKSEKSKKSTSSKKSKSDKKSKADKDKSEKKKKSKSKEDKKESDPI